MNTELIFMNATTDKRVLQYMSTSLLFSILSVIFSTTLMCSIIVTYLSLYQVFSHVLVLVMCGSCFEDIAGDISFRRKDDGLFSNFAKN